MKALLEGLIQGVRLSREESYNLMVDILSGSFSDAQIASLLTIFRMRMISGGEFQGMRKAMIEHAMDIKFEQTNRIDIVGTGGDGKNSFNISTLCCFIVAGAGYFVSKHGNYGVSSISGSSNVLEKLGYTFTNDQSTLQAQLDRANICFLHAPLFHPSMKNVAHARRELKIKTLFNLLGPVANPSKPNHLLLGVYDETVAEMYQSALSTDELMVNIVHSLDGYDEVSLTSPFIIWDRSGKKQMTSTELGFNNWQESDLYGGESIDDAATIFQNILKGKGTDAQNEVVLVNASLAIQLLEPRLSFDDCKSKAKESLESGNALKKLHLLVKS